ncbi:MAG: hypothetical protein H6557_34355 [Lewinellaceae bacterium]|nr:hypothetical protein [Phaeodactylibacter sp.]MCB9041725.1 hypothetical protein [Lewinellaceae bacterium]
MMKTAKRPSHSNNLQPQQRLEVGFFQRKEDEGAFFRPGLLQGSLVSTTPKPPPFFSGVGIPTQPVSKTSSGKVIQRSNGEGNLGRLNEMLDSINVPEEEVITLCGLLTDSEKATVLAGGYRPRMANALNVEEMVRAVNYLGAMLSTKLEWVNDAAFTTGSIDYSDISGMVSSAPQNERNMLKINYWRGFFVDVCTNETMITALDELGFDLETKLDWIEAELHSNRMELSYSTIQPWIVHPNTTQSEKDGLKTNRWKTFFGQICTNETMITALNDLGFDRTTRREWMAAEGITVYAIIEKSDFLRSIEGVTLSSELENRVRNLCEYLIDQNLVSENITFNEGARSKIKAHRWSTAYHIRQGEVPLSNLQALDEGMDLDGNLWYKEGWTWDQIVENAENYWGGKLAHEGYKPGTAERLPNIDAVPVSNHCLEKSALDASIRWRNGDGWHAEAIQLVSRFGLARPISTEHWHFELP